MKRYLLVGIALLFVSANASLKEDFAQMDLEEEQLLSDMRKSAAMMGEEDEIEETVVSKKAIEPEKVEEVTPSTPEENSAVMAASLDAVTSESESVDEEDDSKARLDAMRQRVVEEARKKEEVQKAAAEEAKKQEEAKRAAQEEAKKIEAQREEEKKAEALKAEIASKEAEIKKVKAAEAAAKAQREEEKREVEAYEKQRAEKLAKEAAEKAELEKVQLAQKSLEEEKIAASKAEAISPEFDVNVSRELAVKTQAADEEYKNAIKEMSEED